MQVCETRGSTGARHARRDGGPGRLAAALLLGLALLSGCRTGTDNSSCGRCHEGIEVASRSHPGCTSCHGGNPRAETREGAHAGIFGLANASYPGRWEQGCGPCHPQQLARMRSSQMFTNAGMIAQIQATWEGEREGGPFAAAGGAVFAPDGSPGQLRPVAELDHLSGELYRKFCARCHVGKQNAVSDGAGHPAGCAACHFPWAEDGAYHGRDRTMRDRPGHSADHVLQGLPPMSACQRCHQRSGRIALSYQGLLDDSNALVPTRNGGPGPVPASDGRSLTHIAPDAHFAAGMECIDCHTGREVMGEGYAAAAMAGQLEIGCEDCHGDGLRRPATAEVWREHEAPLRESRQYAARVRPGTRMALTRRGRPYSNVFARGDSIVVQLKRSGRELRSPVITGTPEHRIAGHERMACTTCHSRTVTQCYGCHTTYDRRENGTDFIADRDTPGAFREQEDVRTLRPFPLALDAHGRVSPVTPGCQTFVTVIAEDGTPQREESVARYRGKPQLRFAPFFGHNTASAAVGCAECHGEPAWLGFGQNVVERGRPRALLLCEKNPAKPLDGFLAMEGGRVVAHAAIARDGARPLQGAEVRRVFAVNLCLVCHDGGRDPIYRSPLDYRALDDSLHRRLLAAGR